MAHPTEFSSTGVDFPIRWSQLSFTLHLKVLSPNQFGEIPPDWWGIYEQTARSSQENTSARLVQCKICKIAKRCSAIGSLHESHHLSLLSLIDTTWQPLTNRRAGACKCMMTAMKNQMLCIGTSGLSATFESGHTEKNVRCAYMYRDKIYRVEMGVSAADTSSPWPFESLHPCLRQLVLQPQLSLHLVNLNLRKYATQQSAIATCNNRTISKDKGEDQANWAHTKYRTLLQKMSLSLLEIYSPVAASSSSACFNLNNLLLPQTLRIMPRSKAFTTSSRSQTQGPHAVLCAKTILANSSVQCSKHASHIL